MNLLTLKEMKLVRYIHLIKFTDLYIKHKCSETPSLKETVQLDFLKIKKENIV